MIYKTTQSKLVALRTSVYGSISFCAVHFESKIQSLQDFNFDKLNQSGLNIRLQRHGRGHVTCIMF